MYYMSYFHIFSTYCKHFHICRHNINIFTDVNDLWSHLLATGGKGHPGQSRGVGKPRCEFMGIWFRLSRWFSSIYFIKFFSYKKWNFPNVLLFLQRLYMIFNCLNRMEISIWYYIWSYANNLVTILLVSEPSLSLTTYLSGSSLFKVILLIAASHYIWPS